MIPGIAIPMACLTIGAIRQLQPASTLPVTTTPKPKTFERQSCYTGFRRNQSKTVVTVLTFLAMIALVLGVTLGTMVCNQNKGRSDLASTELVVMVRA